MGERTSVVRALPGESRARALSPALFSLAALFALSCKDEGETPAPPQAAPPPISSEHAAKTPPAYERPAPTCEIESLVVFEQAPDHPQRMIATFNGDRRARLWLGTLDRDSPERRLIYRNEARVFGIQPQTSTSHELNAADATRTIVQFELRRAAYLWPEGFEWRAEGPSFVAPIAGSLGTITATFAEPVAPQAADEKNLPIAFHSQLQSGDEFERYGELAWEHGRLSGLTLLAGGQRIWKERLESFEPRARFVSSYFLPADRRSGTTGLGEAMAQGALLLELPQRTVLHATFEALAAISENNPSAPTLAQARLVAQRQRSIALTELEGLELEPGYALELDAKSHRPLALLLWPLTSSVPPNFTRRERPERRAAGLLLTPRELLDPSMSLAQLRAQFPAKSEAAERYEIHFGEGDPETGEEWAQLVWAYEARASDVPESSGD